MTAPTFKARIRFADDNGFTQSERDSDCPHKVRVTDARYHTPERAVEKVLQEFFDTALKWDCPPEFRYTRTRHLARAAGMEARVDERGRLRVRKLTKKQQRQDSPSGGTAKSGRTKP